MTSTKKRISKNSQKYIEAILYAFLIVIVIFANTFGPYYIKMLPFLLLLGAVGKIIFGRPVVTSVFGMVVSLCMIYMSGEKSIVLNLLLSGCATLLIALGEVLGEYAKKCYQYSSKKSKRITKEAFKQYGICGLLVIVCCIVHILLSGNIFMYAKEKEKVSHYLQDTYQGKTTFHIMDGSYQLLPSPHYTFPVKEESSGIMCRFLIYVEDQDHIIDGYAQNMLAKNNQKIQEEFQEYSNKMGITNLYTDMTYTMSISEDRVLQLEIITALDSVTNEKVKTYAKQVVSLLEALQAYERYPEIQEVHLVLEDTLQEKNRIATTIYMQGYKEAQSNHVNLEQYVLDSLHIEYFE